MSILCVVVHVQQVAQTPEVMQAYCDHSGISREMAYQDAKCFAVQEGKIITKGKPKVPKELESGATFDLGNFVCEFDQDIDYDSYK